MKNLVKAHDAASPYLTQMRNKSVAELVLKSLETATRFERTIFIFETPHCFAAIFDNDRSGLSTADSHCYPLTLIVTASGVILQILDEGLIGVVDNIGLNPRNGIV